jgi:large-conductance mechanosensitive channel
MTEKIFSLLLYYLDNFIEFRIVAKIIFICIDNLFALQHNHTRNAQYGISVRDHCPFKCCASRSSR